jgi:hypothetical protein
MNKDTYKKDFAEIMIGIAENFSSEIGKIGLKMRFEALKHYSIEQLRAAAMVILQTRVYTTLPPVSDFIIAIEGKADDMAEIQANIVLRAITQCGSYNPPVFDDQITQSIISNFNWRNLCVMDAKDLNFRIKDFKSSYKSFDKAASGHMLNAPDEFKKLANTATKRISMKKGN